ncbi:MAG: Y-family DNA polymerase [Bacteroidales bacterium]|nr:Y-family DNA polymerase [Bacteroidales bacterium]
MQLFALADCNNFFCSCERVFRPELRNKPVVVLSNNDGCIVARSNEAKALGLQMGTPAYQVRELLEREHVATFSSNYALYGDMSRRVMSLLSKYSPRIDVYSIDEAFLDFSGIGDSDKIHQYACEMVRFVSKGTGIPISVGIAPTKTLAKMATKFAKKYPGYRGACLIDTDEKREKALRLFPLEDVWGIGRRYAKKMAEMGLHTAWDFTQKHPDWVRRVTNILGLQTWKELRGESCISIDELPFKKSICTSRSFPGLGISKLGDLEEAVASFASHTVRKLRERGSACQTLLVFAHTSRFRLDMPSHYLQSVRRLPTATSCLTEIVDAAMRALRAQWQGERYLYKRAGIVVWDICPESRVQLSLFDTQDRGKLGRLQKAIDVVNRTNGHDSLRTAVQGFGDKRPWHLQSLCLSRQYTTNLRQILRLAIK